MCVRFESAGLFAPQHAPTQQAGVQPHQVLKAPHLLLFNSGQRRSLGSGTLRWQDFRLASGILDLSKMEAIKMTLDLKPISVGS